MNGPSVLDKRRRKSNGFRTRTIRQSKASGISKSNNFSRKLHIKRNDEVLNNKSHNLSSSVMLSSHGEHFEKTSDDDITIKTKVVVYILSVIVDSDNVKLLSNLFVDPMFIVKVVNIPPPVGLNNSDSMSIDQKIEAFRVTMVLTDAATNYPNLDVIIIKDNSSTNSSADDVTVVVKTILDEAGWDLCYLCRWLDRCDLYRNARAIPGKTSFHFIILS